MMEAKFIYKGNVSLEGIFGNREKFGEITYAIH